MQSKYKIVFLGDQSVGKTTLISQITTREADEGYHPTIGIDFTFIKLNLQGKEVRLQLWDTAGQERFNSLIPTYTRGSFAAIVLFDLHSMRSFESLDHWIKDLVLINDPERLINIIIVGNKKDLVTEKEREEIKIKGIEKAKQYNGKYIETCASKYEDIKELINYVNQLVINDFTNEKVQEDEKVLEIQAEKKNCC